MKDLLALVELFNLKVVGENVDAAANFCGIPTILIDVGNNREPVIICKTARGYFSATDKIDGVPMHYFGNGSWRYIIEI